MLHMHAGFRTGRTNPVLTLHALLPCGLHRRLAHAIVHLPNMHGAGGRRPAVDVR